MQRVHRALPPSGISLLQTARVRVHLSAQLASQTRSQVSAWHRSLGIPSTNPSKFCDEDGIIEQEAVTSYAVRLSLSLADIVRARRGELGDDSRPNKGLDPERLQFLLRGYPHADLLVKIARHGILPAWKREMPPPQDPPRNHNSARVFKSALMKSIRRGQANGTYLVVSRSLLHQWKNIQCSPFGAVEKKDVDPRIEVRPIHDLSYPDTASTNKFFDVDCLPEIEFICVVAIARRIEWIARTNPGVPIKILKGDVKSAFRHLMMHAEHACWMGATFPDEDALVVDLAAPFGWSGSPAFYSAFGRAITWLVSINSPSSVSDSPDDELFFGYEWVDDHILVEPDRDSRLELAEATLRLSMMAVLGPDSINDSKFSEWSTELQALGLIWNTCDRTVSMPPEKIKKCLDRVSLLMAADRSSKQQLQKLLGSLRHVTTCLRAAKPFFQQLQVVCNRLRPFQSVRLSEATRRDLQWFHHILSDGHLEKLPLRYFGDLPVPTINFYMDASNTGLTVLNPARDEFIQIRFDDEETRLIEDPEETDFNINVREHFCMTLAAWCWGPQLLSDFNHPHVVCWSDNVSAVSWINRFHAQNRFGQEINRAIGLAEAVFKFRMSARHLPGASARALEADLQDILRVMQSNSLAKSSQERYRSSWRQWQRWCADMEYSPWLPNDPAAASRQLVLFAVYCYRYGSSPNVHRGNSLQTIQSKISAVAWYHRMEFGFNVSLLPHHAMAIKGIHRLQPSPQPKQPVTVSLLRALHQLLDFTSAHDRVLWGATVMGFFFLLRRSEYLRDGNKQYQFAIRRSDVTFYDQEGNQCTAKRNIHRVELNFRGGKNDQAGVGVSRSLTTSSLSWCCPVRALWFLVEHHRTVSNDPDELLCKVQSGQFLQVRDVNLRIKRAANIARQDPSRFSTHSLRIGGATALFAAGVDSLTIKLFGRWRSSAFERYTRIDNHATATMASQMVNSTTEASLHCHHFAGLPPRRTRAGGGANTSSFMPHN